MAFCASPHLPSSLRFESFHRRIHGYKISSVARCDSRKVFGPCFVLLNRQNSSVRSFAVAREKSKHFEVDVEKEKNTQAEESQEAWKEALASFKEQALKMQSVSQGAYDVYSKKAVVVLKETSEQLKIKVDKTRYDLIVVMKEINEESQEYLSKAAERSPEPVKDIMETFASSKDDLKDISKTRDFCLGIPYGAVLSLGGFLSFMITGSISAVRFGVILGGTLLALSISSMKSQKRGESFSVALKGQAAIASIIFIRELRLFFQRSSFGGLLAALISGAMVAFYVYRIISNGKPKDGLNLEHGTET